MSESLADYYTANGHFSVSLNCGVVTVMVRNAIGESAACTMNLRSWNEMIERSRSKMPPADGEGEAL